MVGGMQERPRVTRRVTKAAGRFLELQALEWVDAAGAVRQWESAARRGSQAAVVIVAVLQPSDRVVLIRQFRPPADGVVLEFPAGLIDAGETPQAAALRELREETGYVGRAGQVSDFAFSSPGMSGETVAFVEVAVEEAANVQPTAAPDEGEQIEVLSVPRRELAAFCRAQAAAGIKLDSKVVAYALAIAAQGGAGSPPG